MSESFGVWLRSYLTKVAETHGGKLDTVPLGAKRLVQIIECFAFPGVENQTGTAIWAIVSDKEVSIPIKFSKEAVIAYNASGRRTTELKSALVTIERFKPVSCRIPVQGGGMTPEAHLALQCDSVSLIAPGEGRWGNPKSVESDSPLQEWSLGLRQDGGAGNVLMERKKARETEMALPPAKSPMAQPHPPFKSRPQPEKPKTTAAPAPDPMHEYNKRWHKNLTAHPLFFARPPSPEQEMEDARNLGSSSPSQKYSVASSSPYSNWSATPMKQAGDANRAASHSPSLPQMDLYTPRQNRSPMSEDSPSLPSSQGYQTPTPAHTSSQSEKANRSLLATHSRGRKRSRSAEKSDGEPPRVRVKLESSAPTVEKNSSSLTAPTPAQRKRPSPPHRLVSRKVSRPPEPPPVGSGPAQILAPNSSESQPSQSQHRASQQSRSSQQSKLEAFPSQEESQVSQQPSVDADAEVLDEDDAQTEQRLFQKPRRGRKRLDGFSIGFDYVARAEGVVGWEQVWRVLARMEV